jgi:putative endonuclease
MIRPFSRGSSSVKPAHDGQCTWLYPAYMGGFVYILSNKSDGTLYVGVTNDLSRRVNEHREKHQKGFTARYGLDRLVYYESYDDIRLAIQREKAIKHWPRLWKLALIQVMNPDWNDLYETLNW